MRVFVAGATGAIGRQLVPRLVAAGHEVHGMTRYGSKQAMLEALGAVPVVADALAPDQVAEAVARARPEVIVDQLTAIGALDMRHFGRDFALTNRLRTEGTDHLLSAGQAVGVRRFVAQAIAGYGAYVRTGGPVKSEERPRLVLAPAALSWDAATNRRSAGRLAELRPRLACFGHGFAVIDPGRFVAAVQQAAAASPRRSAPTALGQEAGTASR